LKIADKLNIIDKPNERSSHNYITVRGAGILFPIAFILASFFFQFKYIYLFIGVLLVSSISLLDDLKGVKNSIRFIFHIIAVSLMFYDLGLFGQSLPITIIAYIISLGWINAFNFMDGINGITVFYSTSVLLSVLFLLDEPNFVLLVNLMLMSLFIFGLQNVRKKALAFCGDIGSVSLAFILAFLIIYLMLRDHTFLYILFLSVYGVDSVLTILHRLIKRENIFKAHRSHLYQYMTNKCGYSHIFVSAIYSAVQLSISLLTVFFISSLSTEFQWLSGILILFALSLFYILYKRKIEQSGSF